MNLPNKLTLLRMILVPVVVVLILVDSIPLHWLWAGIVFGIASVTDALDGNIARKRGLVTDFGKLMDPIADKLLVISAFVCFITVSLPNPNWGVACSPWVVIIILAREFLVTSARMIYAERGIVIAANIWGKLKTVIQIVSIVTIFVVMFALELLSIFELGNALIDNIASIVIIAVTWLSALITVISGGTYLYQCRDLLKDAK